MEYPTHADLLEAAVEEPVEVLHRDGMAAHVGAGVPVEGLGRRVTQVARLDGADVCVRVAVGAEVDESRRRRSLYRRR
jgi:hypothetical protein